MTETPTAEITQAKHEADVSNGSNKKLRSLHVPIDEKIYWHLRKMALESQLPFKQYMALFLSEAWPYPPGAKPRGPAMSEPKK